MSSPVQVGGQPRRRPTVVTVAVWLLFLVAALQLISLVVELSQVGTIADTYEAAYRGTGDEDAMRTGAVIGSVGGAALGALFGIAYLVLAIFNARGKNAARITTWVFAGLGVCCGTLGVIGSAVSSFNFGGSTDNGPDPDDVRRQLEDALPSWYTPVVITLAVLALLSLLAVIVLLALPPANEFFRKPEQVWQPPTYPQAGGYPQPGGYPAPGSYYPPPAAPPAPGIPPPSWSPPGPAAPPPSGPSEAERPSEAGRPSETERPPEAGAPPAPGGPPA